jgi:transcriptional regulator with XRE-family HTH domain
MRYAIRSGMVDGATRLRAYLARRKLSHQAFADRVGTTAASVSRWANGKRVPKVPAAIAISKATRRAVPVEAWSEPIDKAA